MSKWMYLDLKALKTKTDKKIWGLVEQNCSKIHHLCLPKWLQRIFSTKKAKTYYFYRKIKFHTRNNSNKQLYCFTWTFILAKMVLSLFNCGSFLLLLMAIIRLNPHSVDHFPPKCGACVTWFYCYMGKKIIGMKMRWSVGPLVCWYHLGQNKSPSKTV